MNIPIMPQEVKYILNKLKENNYEGYIVGGCVRDALMGVEPKDWDITTSATPVEVKALFNHTVDTGIKHGTVTVVINKGNFEITTYRVESEYIDCRHPSSVEFTRVLHEDLLRRDFTMNAIAFCEEEGYVDIFGGIQDIEKHIIRGVGCASERFQEDALRMLRAVRFSVQLDFEIESQTLTALKENAKLIKHISSERVREELTKTLLGNFIERINVLFESGLMENVSKELYIACFQNVETLKELLKKLPKNVAIRYAAFFSLAKEEDWTGFLKWLKFDNKTKKLIEGILNNLNIEISSNPQDVRRVASKIGISALDGVYEIRKAMGNEESQRALEVLKVIIDENQCISIKQLAISGSDLLELGFEKGEALGNMLNKLLDMVVENPDLNSLNDLKKIAIDNK